MRYSWWLLVACLVSGLTIVPLVSGQVDHEHSAWEVYVMQDIDDEGNDQLQFLDLLRGEMTVAAVDGERYTALADYVLYYDRQNRAVMTARPDGTVSPHPFVQLDGARRIDWMINADSTRIAWTLTYDEAEGIRTETYLASIDGSDIQLVLSDGVREDGIRVLPVAFAAEYDALILDAQPDGIGDLASYRQYASLFRLSLSDNQIIPLPDDRACFCAAAYRAGYLLRLVITPQFNSFDVSVTNLNDESRRLIPAVETDQYTQGGNILIAPDGHYAVYALSQVRIDDPDAAVQTLIMLVNLETMTQTILSNPIRSYLQPVGWTEDNTAILFTIPGRDGTWKMTLSEGILQPVASATYIGIIEK